MLLSTFLRIFTRITSALFIYDKRTLLDIGHCCTNLLQDTLSTDPAWPLEILRNTEVNKSHLNNRRRRKKHHGSVTLPISMSGSSRQSSDHVITVSEDEVWRELKRVNVRKTAGPDGITGRVLRSCDDQLACLFTSIFNESLATSVVPTPFKKSYHHPCA